MATKRHHLPRATDRRVEFVAAWPEPDGRLGIEVGVGEVLLLTIDQLGLAALAAAVDELRHASARKR